MDEKTRENLTFDRDEYGQAITGSVHDDALAHLGYRYDAYDSTWKDPDGVEISSREVAERCEVDYIELMEWENARDYAYEDEWRAENDD